MKTSLVLGVVSPSNGTVSLLADQKTARFVPATNFSGKGMFLYTVRDGGNNVRTAGVEVTILPATWYWDGSPSGGLQAVNGIWSGTNAMWATGVSGAGPLQVWPRTGNDAVFVGAGGTSTVTVIGTQRVNHIMTSNGTWIITGGTLQHTDGPMIIVAQATGTVIKSSIFASGDLVKSGVGTLILNGTNQYPGATIVNSGTLVLVADNVLPRQTEVVLGTSSGTVASLILSNCSQVVASLRFGSPAGGTNLVSIAPGKLLAISHLTNGVALGIGGFGSTLGSQVATTHVIFTGGGSIECRCIHGQVFS
jgi:fibronectin-binding autotransporter adhesin